MSLHDLRDKHKDNKPKPKVEDKPVIERAPTPEVDNTPYQPPAGAEPDDGEKTYKLTEEQLQRLMNGERQQNIFERDLEPVEEEAATPRTYTCTVAVWQKDYDSPLGVVTDLKTIRHDKDPQTQLYNVDIIRATISYEDGKTESFEYPIGDHIKIFTMKETVEIVKEERKKMKMDRGMIYKAKSRKEGGINTRMSGELSETMVPMRERFSIPIITVKRKNGQVLVLPPRVVNI